MNGICTRIKCFFTALFMVTAITACAADLTGPTDVHYVTSIAPVSPPQAFRVGIGSHGSPNEAPLMQQVGVRNVRVTFYTQQDTPQYEAEFDARMVDLRTHGLLPLVVVHDFGYKPSTADTLFSRLARRYPGTAWQVGNEHDAVQGYTGTQYAALMQRVAPAIRAADRTATIVGMGLASTDGQPWAFQGDALRQSTFAADYLNHGGPVLDAWAIHVYGYPLANAMTQRVKATQAVLHGVMPLWVTETGFDARTVFSDALLRLGFQPQADALQATSIVQGIDAARKLGVARVYVYQLWDATDNGFGLLRANAVTRKQSWFSLQSYLQQYPQP